MRKISWFLVVFMMLSQPLFAGSSVNTPLTLEEALRLAYVHHPSLQEARNGISAAKGRWIQAEALPNPEMAIEVGGFKKTDEGSQKKSIDKIEVFQPLDPLGTRFLRGRMAWNDVKIAKGNLDLAWAEVRQNIIALYARILTQEKALEISRENLNTTRQFFTRVETRFQSGNALQSDVIRAKIEVSRAENDLMIVEKDLKVSNGEMNLALGRMVETPLELADSLAYEALQFQYSKIIEQALSQRADIHNESIQLDSKKKGLGSALLKAVFPEMGIGIGRTTQDFENDTSIILKASYPLWGFNLGQVKEAKAEKEIQKTRLEALKRQISLEVYQAFLEAELADKQVALQKKALDEANELLRQITIRYESGEVPFLTFLENIKTIKETRLAYYDALRNYKEKTAALERIVQATPIPEGASK